MHRSRYELIALTTMLNSKRIIKKKAQIQKQNWKEESNYLGLPTAPLLYARNLRANTSDIFDFSAHKENTSLVPIAMPKFNLATAEEQRIRRS